MNALGNLEVQYIEKVNDHINPRTGAPAKAFFEPGRFSLYVDEAFLFSCVVATEQPVDYLVVMVSFEESEYPNKSQQESDREIEVCADYFKYIKQYWIDYSIANGYAGIILTNELGSPQSTKTNTKRFLRRVTDAQHSLSEHFNLVSTITYGDLKESFQPFILSFHLNEEGLHQFQAFIKVKKIMETVLKDNLLLRPERLNTDTQTLFYEPLKVKYCGMTFAFIVQEKTFDRLFIKQIDIHGETTKELPLDADKIQDVLQIIKEQSKLKLLLEPPRTSFTEYWSKHHYRPEEIQKMFDGLIDSGLTWEKIEIDFRLMLLYSVAPKWLVSNEDHIRRKRIKLTCSSYAEEYYFVISELDKNKSEEQKLSIFYSKTALNETVSKRVEEGILTNIWGR